MANLVVVMWGRSNCVGHGQISELTTAEQQVDSRWQEWEYLGSPWTEPAVDQIWHHGGPQVRYNGAGVPQISRFGPDLFTGIGLADAGYRTSVVKYGFGGSTLDQWLPSANLYYREAVRETRAALSALNSRYRIVAFALYNCEGESGASALSAYPSNMDTIITAFRGDFGDPAIPFIFMGACDNWTIANASGLKAVQQSYAASRQNTVMVDTTGFSVITEEDETRIHFDTPGSKALGLASANAILTRLGQ